MKEDSMSLKLKWHARQIARAILTAPLSLTFAILILCAFRAYQFYTYGLGMYPRYSFPKTTTLQYDLAVFWRLSLSSLLPWLLAALPLDILLRRFGWKLYE
jgi:hypothetical protein